MKAMRSVGVVFLYLISSTALAVVPSNWSIRGEATRLDTQELFYTEYHELLARHPDGQEHWRIHYISPEGQLKAQKDLTYGTQMPFVPELVWQDFAPQLTITGQIDGDSVNQDTQDPLRSEQRTATITQPNQTAFDAGFERLLRSQFDTLLQQGRIRFDFLSLNTSQTFRFRAVVVAYNEASIQVRVEPETAFIRLFVDPIVLTYDITTQHLIRYVGVTNFRREGDLVTARIEYENQGERP